MRLLDKVKKKGFESENVKPENSEEIIVDKFPFADAPNTACFTCRHVLKEHKPKFEPLYEQQKLEHFLPTRQQQDVVEHMPLGAWDNPYFEALPPEHFALFVPSQSLYVCMQTSESEFDYTLYDSQEHILDGGRLTGNGAWTIWDAMNDLFEELEVDWKDIIILDHDRVKDWIESGGEK